MEVVERGQQTLPLSVDLHGRVLSSFAVCRPVVLSSITLEAGEKIEKRDGGEAEADEEQKQAVVGSEGLRPGGEVAEEGRRGFIGLGEMIPVGRVGSQWQKRGGSRAHERGGASVGSS